MKKTYIKLSEAAKLITEISKYHIDRQALWNQIKKGYFFAKRIGTPFFMKKNDVIKFAKNYKGYFEKHNKGGRPAGSKDTKKRKIRG